jgi:hypothetical protein
MYARCDATAAWRKAQHRPHLAAGDGAIWQGTCCYDEQELVTRAYSPPPWLTKGDWSDRTSNTLFLLSLSPFLLFGLCGIPCCSPPSTNEAAGVGWHRPLSSYDARQVGRSGRHSALGTRHSAFGTLRSPARARTKVPIRPFAPGFPFSERDVSPSHPLSFRRVIPRARVTAPAPPAAQRKRACPHR